MIFLATGTCCLQALIDRITSRANHLEKPKSVIFPGLIEYTLRTFHRTAKRSYSVIRGKDRESTTRFIWARRMAHPLFGLAMGVHNGCHPMASGRSRFSTLLRNRCCCRLAQGKPDRWSAAPSSNTVEELAGFPMGSEWSSKAGSRAMAGVAMFRASRAARLARLRLRAQRGLHQ